MYSFFLQNKWHLGYKKRQKVSRHQKSFANGDSVGPEEEEKTVLLTLTHLSTNDDQNSNVQLVVQKIAVTNNTQVISTQSHIPSDWEEQRAVSSPVPNPNPVGSRSGGDMALSVSVRMMWTPNRWVFEQLGSSSIGVISCRHRSTSHQERQSPR